MRLYQQGDLPCRLDHPRSATDVKPSRWPTTPPTARGHGVDHHISRGHRLVKRLHAGSVQINCQLIFDHDVPFGWQSGWGHEFGKGGLDGYLQDQDRLGSALSVQRCFGRLRAWTQGAGSSSEVARAARTLRARQLLAERWQDPAHPPARRA